MMGYGLYGAGSKLKGKGKRKKSKSKKGNGMVAGGGLSTTNVGKGQNNSYNKWVNHGLSLLKKK